MSDGPPSDLATRADRRRRRPAVIADADAGFGNPRDVLRTVTDLERRGAAAIQLEDQEMPKKCGHEPGRRLVPVEEMVAEIEAARAARASPELVTVARTDARTTEMRAICAQIPALFGGRECERLEATFVTRKEP